MSHLFLIESESLFLLLLLMMMITFFVVAVAVAAVGMIRHRPLVCGSTSRERVCILGREEFMGKNEVRQPIRCTCTR